MDFRWLFLPLTLVREMTPGCPESFTERMDLKHVAAVPPFNRSRW